MADSGPTLFNSIQPTSYLYVSADAAAGGDGSRDHPYNAIQQAVNAATAGTAIMVEAGEYHENIKLPSVSPSTAAAPIWLVSADGQGAAKIIAPSNDVAAIYGYGTDNYIVQNFAIEGGKNGIQFSQSGSNFTNMVQNVAVVGNIVQDTLEDGIKIDQGNNVQIFGNSVHNTGQEGVDFVAVNNSVVAYNDVSDASGSAGIMIKGGSTNVLVANNDVHDIPKMDGILVGGWTGDQFFVPGYTGYEADNVTVVNNEVHNVAKRPVNVLGAINSTILHNYLQANASYNWAITVADGYPQAQTIAHSANIQIYGNIIANTQKIQTSADSLDISVHDNAASGAWTTQTGPAAMPSASAGAASVGIFALAPTDYYVTQNGDGSYAVQGPGGTNTLAGDADTFFATTSQALSMAQFAAQSFDPLEYIASNPDLLVAYGDDQALGLQHYLLHGEAEGRPTASFNALEYIASNTDLLVGFGDNQTLALEHYILHGYAEGRSTTSFNALEYIASNPDLLAGFGDNQTLALEHYILHGHVEGRSTTSFNALEYIASNPDLIGTLSDNQNAALEQYILTGYGQGRPTASFDVLEYVASNPDLAKVWGSANANLGYEHYILHGHAEGRSTNSFDAVAYLLSNPDLQNGSLTAQGAELHYLNHGVDEGRSPSGAFGTEQTQHALTLGTQLSDTIATSGDEDWFSVNLTAGQSYNLLLSGADSGSGTLADPKLELHSATGVLIASDNDSGPGKNALIHITATSTGTFYLVAAANTAGTGTYKILVAMGGGS